ncbi:hypothetical protein [Kineosporia sp. R_H_3]|uniref:hypothetical protein n=1 Tax=Kineosporia sp. R_H_3 TaxID=1961848 RepID=UPI00117BC18C|nr:hypothetical protein [Kineosporia sp. R_H_3]
MGGLALANEPIVQLLVLLYTAGILVVVVVDKISDRLAWVSDRLDRIFPGRLRRRERRDEVRMLERRRWSRFTGLTEEERATLAAADAVQQRRARILAGLIVALWVVVGAGFVATAFGWLG